MSAWGEMRKRSSGELIRKEDKTEEENLWRNIFDQSIIYAGNIDKFNFPKSPNPGEVYFVQEGITIDNMYYAPSSMLLYDGKKWINVGVFTHERIDSNIDYYTPIIQADSRF